MAKRKYKPRAKKVKAEKVVVLKSYSFPEHSLTIQAINMEEAKKKLSKLTSEGVNK